MQNCDTAEFTSDIHPKLHHHKSGGHSSATYASSVSLYCCLLYRTHWYVAAQEVQRWCSDQRVTYCVTVTLSETQIVHDEQVCILHGRLCHLCVNGCEVPAMNYNPELMNAST